MQTSALFTRQSIVIWLYSTCSCDHRCADSWYDNDIKEAGIATYSVRDYNKSFYGTLRAIYTATSTFFMFQIAGSVICQDVWLDYYGYFCYMFNKLCKHIIEDTKPFWDHHSGSLVEGIHSLQVFALILFRC